MNLSGSVLRRPSVYSWKIEGMPMKTIAVLLLLAPPVAVGAQSARNDAASAKPEPQVGAPVMPHSFDGDLAALAKAQGWSEGMPVRVGTRRRPSILPPPRVADSGRGPPAPTEAGS